MPRFRYQALNADGHPVTGEVEAAAVAAAIEQLEASGLTLQAISIATAEPTDLFVTSQHAPAPEPLTSGEARDEAVLRTHLALTVEQARSLTEPLSAYVQELPTGRRRTALAEMCRIVEQGDLEAARASFESSPEYWIPLIGSSAIGRDSASVLQKFIVESREIDETRRQWWTLLAYPLFLVGFALLVLVLLARLVVPTFRSIFHDFSLELPAITRWTIGISEWLATAGPLVTAAVVILGVAALIKFAGPKLADLFGAWFGRSTALALYSSSIGDLLAGDISLVDAVRIAGQAAKGRALRRSSQRLALQLEGGGLTGVEALRRSLSATVIHAVTVEMSTPARSQLLQTIGRCYADRSQARASWTQGLLGPVTIFVVGVVVAMVALSLFLPLVSLVNNLT